jgi:ATP-dependent DNA helicase DinG
MSSATEAPQADVTADSGVLATTDLVHFFGPGGPIATALEGYELRPSQVAMAEAVQRALLSESIALIEAPTGTGKSIAYLVPAILSGKTVVVATANKSLQNQLYTKDLPFLGRVLGAPIDAVVVKGRSNFICTLKWEKEQVEQRYISLYDREDAQMRQITAWLDATDTGDVDDLPFVVNPEIRPRIVSFPDDCLHSDCRHAQDNCWVNRMRDKAATAQVLITNHHLLLNALELGAAGERILPPAAVYIIDEAHGLEQTATAVFETAVTDYTVEQLLMRAVYRDHVDEDEIDGLRLQNALAFQEAANLSRDNAYRIEGDLEQMRRLGHALKDLAQRLKQRNPFGGPGDLDIHEEAPRAEGEVYEERRIYELGIEALNSVAVKLLTVASASRDDALVRYAVRVFDRRHVSLELHAAPLDPSGLLARFLFHPEGDGEPVPRTVICTSATLATHGAFEHFKARCGIRTTGEEWVLPAVFDYPRQALLYQPALPPFDHRRADAYYAAAAAEIARLIEVSRGRTLCLFTSWSGLQQTADLLQAPGSGVIWPLRAQNDAPRNALLSWFLETPHSVLLATRSFWEGVDIPGDDLSLVVMDKLPFPTPNDPLHSARMKAIEDAGQSSFAAYMVPLMTLALKQGFGRLIRRNTDRGVVAILDDRLSSKGYGRQARQDLPPARYSRDFRDVHRFYQMDMGEAEFALNVWAEPASRANGTMLDALTAGQRWRWQLLRLHDGKADRGEGTLTNATPAEAELHAMIEGLDDLRRRVEQAHKSPRAYAVEVRCGLAAAELAVTGDIPAWLAARDPWRSISFVPLRRDLPAGF